MWIEWSGRIEIEGGGGGEKKRVWNGFEKISKNFDFFECFCKV